jgi:hypothetical protein
VEERTMIITTTKGPMDEALLEKRTGRVDDERELTDWVEYWLNGELVHRSAHVRLRPVAAEGLTGVLG